VPGRGGIGLVEAADVDDVLPESLERRVGLEVRVHDLRPAARRVGRERPRDRPVVDRLERLLEGRQPVLAGARRVDAATSGCASGTASTASTWSGCTLAPTETIKSA
jgi:hypothetical protein